MGGLQRIQGNEETTKQVEIITNFKMTIGNSICCRFSSVIMTILCGIVEHQGCLIRE
jgi:hypothetical protein